MNILNMVALPQDILSLNFDVNQSRHHTTISSALEFIIIMHIVDPADQLDSQKP